MRAPLGIKDRAGAGGDSVTLLAQLKYPTRWVTEAQGFACVNGTDRGKPEGLQQGSLLISFCVVVGIKHGRTPRR